MNNLDAELSGDDGLYGEPVELHDIWRVIVLSRDNLDDELEVMAPDHQHHEAISRAAKLLNEAVTVLSSILNR